MLNVGPGICSGVCPRQIHAGPCNHRHEPSGGLDVFLPTHVKCDEYHWNLKFHDALLWTVANCFNILYQDEIIKLTGKQERKDGYKEFVGSDD